MSDAEARLRDAMDTLIPLTQSGLVAPWTKERLYQLAGVSRATMNRHPAVLEEWDRRVGTMLPNPDGADRRDQIELLKARVQSLKDALDSKTKDIALAATVIATLNTENQNLQSHVNQLNSARIQLLHQRKSAQPVANSLDGR
jgi:hypothetical protein